MMHDGLLEHIVFFFGGATGLGILAHAVSTFPPSSNKYVNWLIGTIQYAVGQRIQASNTFKGDSNAQTSNGSNSGK